jgi:hypothetical protein
MEEEVTRRSPSICIFCLAGEEGLSVWAKKILGVILTITRKQTRISGGNMWNFVRFE